jgi:DNA-directed RNA polymerase specialized sigma24 family protein
VQRPHELRILREAAAVYHMRSLDALIGDEGDDDSWLSSIAAPWEDEDERARRKALERQTAQVLVFLEPWPELQEVLQRHLGGQSSREISLAMGISQHAAILRIKQAQAKAARWPGPGGCAHRDARYLPPADKTASAPEADTSASASNRLAYFQPSLLTELT